MLRLFIAFPLAEDIERGLGRVINDLKKYTRDVKWVTPQNIHLTAKFLGDTDEKLVSKVTAEIDRLASGYQPFPFAIEDMGAFPNLKRPRVIWAGSLRPIEVAAKLAHQLELAMRQLRFEEENRPFKAHLTLGRVRQGRQADDFSRALQDYRFEPMFTTMDRLVLFKSTLTPQGPIYERLHEALLGEARFAG